jgi:hypothetical protein
VYVGIAHNMVHVCRIGDSQPCSDICKDHSRHNRTKKRGQS